MDEPRITMLCVISQAAKDKYHVSSPVCGINKTEKRNKPWDTVPSNYVRYFSLICIGNWKAGREVEKL